MRLAIACAIVVAAVLSTSAQCCGRPAESPADRARKAKLGRVAGTWTAGFWDRFLSDDHVELNGFVGAIGKKGVIDGIASKACHVASYKVGDFTFRRFDARTALLVYRAEQDTTCGAVKVPSPVWATSLFQKRGGRWVNVLYGHSPVLTPPAKRPAS